MGKTRLLREARSKFEAQALVLYGRCYRDAAVAYLPFVEALRSCLEQRPDAINKLEKQAAEAISRLLGKGKSDKNNRPPRAQRSSASRRGLGVTPGLLTKAGWVEVCSRALRSYQRAAPKMGIPPDGGLLPPRYLEVIG